MISNCVFRVFNDSKWYLVTCLSDPITSGSSLTPGLCTSQDKNSPGPSVSKIYSNSDPVVKYFVAVGSSISKKIEISNFGQLIYLTNF